MPKRSRDTSQGAVAEMGQPPEFEDDVILNSEESTKLRVCKAMGFDPAWVEEPDLKTRFRQDIITRIQASEQKPVRAIKVLKDYLRTKSRGTRFPHLVEGSTKELQIIGRDEMEARFSPLRSQPYFGAGPSRHGGVSQPRDKTVSRKRLVAARKCGEDCKKMLSDTAEAIQRDILSLEKTVKAGPVTMRTRGPRLKKEIAAAELEQRRYCKLAQSIVHPMPRRNSMKMPQQYKG